MMKRYFRIIGALVAVCLVLFAMGSLLDLQEVSVAASTDKSPVAGIVGPRVPFYSFLDIDDLTASTWYVLVDLDDNTNFPHIATNSIVLKQLSYTGVLSDALHWDVKVGVVITMGDSASLVDWIYVTHRTRVAQFDEDWLMPEHGLDLLVSEANENLVFAVTSEYTITAAVTTTTELESPATETDVITTCADVGDIIMYVEEIEAGGQLDLSVGFLYDTD